MKEDSEKEAEVRNKKKRARCSNGGGRVCGGIVQMLFNDAVGMAEGDVIEGRIGLRKEDTKKNEGDDDDDDGKEDKMMTVKKQTRFRPLLQPNHSPYCKCCQRWYSRSV